MDFVRIIITGIVQGVGFRPFLYNFLKKYPVGGVLKNTGNLGVTLELHRKDPNFDFSHLAAELKTQIPPIAFIEHISMDYLENIPNVDFSTLTIAKSNPGTGKGLTLPPDISICDECLFEFNNFLNKRYYEYPFIACAQCGPRYTIMKALPYDRPNSTVIDFPFCEECEEDYQNEGNRRFHAQTFNCNQCGPFYYQVTNQCEIPRYPSKKTLEDLIHAILEKKIVALKGIGGGKPNLSS